MMLSANCVNKTGGRCLKADFSDKKPGAVMDNAGRLSYLKDRYQNELPVLSICRYCYNRILNPKPLCLFSEDDAIGRAGIGVLRIHFTVEGVDEVVKVLDAAFGHGENIIKDHTKGHFRKSVE